MQIKKIWQSFWREIWPILVRNIFTLINGLIATLALLLWYFGDARDGLFVGSVVALNALVGIIQELRAKLALARLQALTVARVTILTEQGERQVLVDDIRVGDRIVLKLGDQIPVDGQVVESHNLEVNESLLSGESTNLPKAVAQKLLGGSFVVAGQAVYEATHTAEQSYIAKMTQQIKHYQFSQSPIQRDLMRFIRMMTYLLLGFAVYIVLNGVRVGSSAPSIIKQIAALAGFIVPEGLVLASTLLFAYGAIRMLRRRVLLQQINATEKLGRINVLCVDKTGTLTENTPVFDQFVLQDGVSRADFDRALKAYIAFDKAQTQTMQAIAEHYAGELDEQDYTDGLPFSSERKFGMVRMKVAGKVLTVVVGAPDVLLAICQNSTELKKSMDDFTAEGKRIILVASSATNFAMADFDIKKTKIKLQPLGLIVLNNPLKKGTAQIIDFFKKREVAIKLISGDNPDTVRAIASQAGIEGDRVVTGAELAKWHTEDFASLVDSTHLYARILPEQKEALVRALQDHHLVAMVGDGANDAMAIKQADLGIAMYDGATATKQVADIVLLRSNFSDLPTGVRLSDRIITTIELVASLFFNKVAVGVILFFGFSLAGYGFALVPRNLTVINYFIVGFPVVLWSIWPRIRQRKSHDKSFLRIIWPFSLLNGSLTALATLLCYILAQQWLAGDDQTGRMVVVICLLTLGVGAILLAPVALGVRTDKKQAKLMGWYALAVGLVFSAVTFVPITARFFALNLIAPIYLIAVAVIVLSTLSMQYGVAKLLRRYQTPS